MLQQQVAEGKTSVLVVMKFLVTVARVSMEDCERMAAAFAQHHCDTGQERRMRHLWHLASRCGAEVDWYLNYARNRSLFAFDAA